MSQNILKRSFYTRPTLEVARDLLGKYLVFKSKAGKITEVEAYIGQDDKACHAAGGKTKRNEVMFMKGGYAYVYLIYGLYHCLNVTTEKAGFPSAILIRAIDNPQANGPGKLCRYFGITRAHNGLDLTRSDLYIEDRGVIISANDIGQSKRIGVDYAGESANLPWRFYLKS
jgi:DNA-3-methyladenine glycosylase